MKKKKLDKVICDQADMISNLNKQLKTQQFKNTILESRNEKLEAEKEILGIELESAKAMVIHSTDLVTDGVREINRLNTIINYLEGKQ